jgi:uncharacterized protein YunC (DUF1805 family)
MLKGVSDFIVFDPTPRGGYIGLAIEMKRVKHSATSVEQIEFLQKMAERGYLAVVTKGAAAAEEVLRRAGFMEGVRDVEQDNRIRKIDQVGEQTGDDPGETGEQAGGHPRVRIEMDERGINPPAGDGS